MVTDSYGEFLTQPIRAVRKCFYRMQFVFRFQTNLLLVGYKNRPEFVVYTHLASLFKKKILILLKGIRTETCRLGRFEFVNTKSG